MTMPPIDLPNMTETSKVLTMMRDAIIGHDTRLQSIRDDQNDIKRDVNMLKEATLTGNPSSGLISHSERIRTMETYIEGVKDTIKYWGRLIGGALLLNFLGFSAGIVVAIIKFLPILEKLAAKP